jgi:GNAT superfamily N-acetyltransferase
VTDDMVLRRSGPDEDDALRALNAKAFGNNPKSRAEVTKWQWWGNPFGETLVWVWDDGGRIVGQYVAFFAPARLHGRPARLTLGVDAAIDPEYQGRRLFSPLSRALYDDCNAHDAPLLAYPSLEASVRGIARAGWVQVSRQRVRVTATDPRWLAHRFHLPTPAGRAAKALVFRTSSPAGLVARAVEAPPEDLDELWQAVEEHHPNGISRTAAWWRWRYHEHPEETYAYLEVRDGARLVAATAARVREEFGGRFLCLLEMLAVDERAAKALVAAVAEGALGAVDGIVLTAVPGSRLDHLAGAGGLRTVPRRLDPKPVFFGVVPHPELVPDPTALEWSTAWGDLDHI